jgi:hypothetical protein
MDFGVNTAEPGSIVNLKISSKPNSVVSVCVIDSSIELMKKPVELTHELVSDFVKGFKQSGVSSSYGDKEDLKTLKVSSLKIEIRNFHIFFF